MLSFLSLYGTATIVALLIYLLKKSNASEEKKTKQYKAPKQKVSVVNDSRYDLNKEKGDKFEKYIVGLFNASSGRFRLKRWSSDKIAANGMYDESNMEPDITLSFSGDTTTFLFAIECKWRKDFYNNGIKWAEPRQIENYLRFEKQNKIKVYVAIGVGGSPDKPDKLYFTALQNLHYYPNVFESYLKQYDRNPNHKFFFNQQDKILI